jgi:hypothetical protein
MKTKIQLPRCTWISLYVRNFFTHVAGIILLLSIARVDANGQLGGNDITPTRDFSTFEKSAIRIESASVNRKAVKDLANSYRNGHNEKWFELPDGFVALFSLDRVNYQVTYDKHGSWVRTIRTYMQDRFSRYLIKVLRNTYKGYDITLIQEIDTPTDPIIYIIELTGEKDLVTIGVSEGELQVLRKF